MLSKFGYYHGAAIIRLLEDERCRSVRRQEFGYVVNEKTFVFFKYKTKTRSPWGFNFDQEDIDYCLKIAGEYERFVLGLICGGDGICALDWEEAKTLLGGKAGSITADRKHRHQYSVWGSVEELKNKISVNRWPNLLFEQKQERGNNVSEL